MQKIKFQNKTQNNQKSAKNYSIKFQAKLWKYQAKAAWYFVNLPKEESIQIKYRNVLNTRGWGSLRVTVTIGDTTWQTSIFRDSKNDCYILPIKAEVRKIEKLQEGNLIDLSLVVD